jgi:probable F420-dependent oxidoreductase
MADRRFRFGVVAGQVVSAQQWSALARRVEEVGYDTLLVPDTFNICAPFTALASAATVTERLRVGTFVINAPLRNPASLAWEVASLDKLSGGRFELGIGAGRPGAEGEAGALGVAWGTPGQRVASVADTIARLRAVAADADAAAERGGTTSSGNVPEYLRPTQRPYPPIMVAASGPKLLTVAAREADIVAVGMAGSAGEQDLAERIRVVRDRAGDRFDQLELSVNVFSVGDAELPEFAIRFFGLDPKASKDNQAIAVLNGSPETIADVLLRRRDEFGVSYITVNSFAMEPFLPVLERLAGR